jgi:hypothetical protein
MAACETRTIRGLLAGRKPPDALHIALRERSAQLGQVFDQLLRMRVVLPMPFQALQGAREVGVQGSDRALARRHHAPEEGGRARGFRNLQTVDAQTARSGRARQIGTVGRGGSGGRARSRRAGGGALAGASGGAVIRTCLIRQGAKP